MSTTTRQNLWELASVIAFERLGLVPLRKVDGVCQPPSADLAAMPADAARKARRKYRKLWRRSLVRELKDFDSAPKRRKRHWRWTRAAVRGAWKCVKDPLEGHLLIVQGLEVGQRPSKSARGYRWQRVKDCVEYRAMLYKVADELGLLKKWSNI